MMVEQLTRSDWIPDLIRAAQAAVDKAQELIDTSCNGGCWKDNRFCENFGCYDIRELIEPIRNVLEQNESIEIAEDDEEFVWKTEGME